MLIKILITYIIPLIILTASAILYFKVALHFKIVDNPNQRSSHTVPTIRGGGILFLLAALIFFFWNNFTYPYLITAILISGIISFIDDIITVKNRLKFCLHIISVLLVFKECELFSTVSPLYLVAIAIVVIGTINAYNFMDGINGITGLYSIAIILPLFLTEQNEKLRSLELFLILGLLVFNYFNVRRKARCFAGDVGSISIAIAVIFLLIIRIQQADSFVYIGLLSVYGIDTVFTILQRLYQKENIFKPHRKHLFQYYCNEKGIAHVLVSTIYATLQFFISMAIVFGFVNYLSLIILLILLSIVYWILKTPLIKITPLPAIILSPIVDGYLV